MRNVEGGRNDHVHGASLPLVDAGVVADEGLCLFGQQRQYREQARRHERGHERVARPRDERSIRHRRQCGDETGQYPEREQQRHRDIADHVDLQALQLLNAQSSGDDGGDREHADRRQRHDIPRRLLNGLSDRGQHLEQGGLARDTDERHAENDTEQHHRRHHVVGQRIERVGWNIEVQEVEGFPFQKQCRAEERRALTGREHQGKQQHGGQRERPEYRRITAIRFPSVLACAASRAPSPPMMETVT